MKPVEFPEQTTVYGQHQPDYTPLPARRTTDGAVTSCWAMGWRERLRVLLTGRVYVTALTFGTPLQPLRVSLDPPEDAAQ